MIGAGYQALREGAALLDLEGRGVLIATGDDRARLLHAMSTNQVERLTPGDFCYAFFLNAQGRVLADANVLCLENALLLDTEPERRQFLLQHLDKFIIADDVTLEDATERYAVFGVEGPGARQALETVGVAGLPEPGKWILWRTWILSRTSLTGATGYRIHVPAAERTSSREAILAAGAISATWAEIHAVRLENAHPRYAEDITDGQIPHETRQMHAVSFTKGCYLGQEIVERVRSRGHVNRMLVQLHIDADAAVEKGAKVLAGSAEVGEVTSAAHSPALGKVAALAYLRVEQAKGPLTVDGNEAVVTGRVPGTSE
jgi:folate-binding protein YgfZ